MTKDNKLLTILSNIYISKYISPAHIKIGINVSRIINKNTKIT